MNDKVYCSTESCPSRSDCWLGVKADYGHGVMEVYPYQPDDSGKCDAFEAGPEEPEAHTAPPVVTYVDPARLVR